MYIQIELKHKDAKLPFKKHPNDVGVDIYMPENGVIKRGMNVIPLGIGVKIPDGCKGEIVPRTSTAKQGLVSVPVPIDPGYTGEIHFFVYNCSDNDIEYEKHKRICQLIVSPVCVLVPSLEFTEIRGEGKFGSTGE